ncbi:integrase core domain-containing protein [Streptomyces sp. LZ34]
MAEIPPRSPNCTPHAERFVRSVREECTNRVLLLDRGHVEKMLHDHARLFDEHRPHQGRNQLAPFERFYNSLRPHQRIANTRSLHPLRQVVGRAAISGTRESPGPDRPPSQPGPANGS